MNLVDVAACQSFGNGSLNHQLLNPSSLQTSIILACHGFSPARIVRGLLCTSPYSVPSTRVCPYQQGN